MDFSGPDVAISLCLLQTTYGKLSFQKGSVKHYWPDCHYERSADMGISLGPRAGVVCIQLLKRFTRLKCLRYTPPPSPDTKDGSNQLESTNFENSVLFLLSCFQYILVAGVFSIGPPYRKPMWTNSKSRGSPIKI